MNSDPLHYETPRPPSPPSAVEILVLVVMIGAMLLLPLRWFMHPTIQSLTSHWWNGNENEFVSGWTSYDREILRAAGGPDGANAALRVFTLNPQDPSHVEFAQIVLCRGSYALYPRRVFAAEDGTILNGGPDVIQARFNPSLQWLRDHNVQGVLDGSADASGKVVARILNLPPTGAAR